MAEVEFRKGCGRPGRRPVKGGRRLSAMAAQSDPILLALEGPALQTIGRNHPGRVVLRRSPPREVAAREVGKVGGGITLTGDNALPTHGQHGGDR